MILYMYIAPWQGQTTPWEQILIATERPYHFAHLLHVLRILAVAVCKIGNVCCLPAPAHQTISSNSLDLSVPKEAYSRNVRASGTLKFGYEGVFKV